MTNVHLRRVLEWIERFQTEALTVRELWKNLALIPSLLESDVPSRIRVAIHSCANELEIIDETTDPETARSSANRYVEELRKLLSELESACG